MAPTPPHAREEAAALRALAADQRALACEDAERRRRKIWRRGLLLIMAPAWIGVALVLWSFHTTNSTAGWLAFWSGIGVGDGGALFFFVRTWRQAERVAPS